MVLKSVRWLNALKKYYMVKKYILMVYKPPYRKKITNISRMRIMRSVHAARDSNDDNRDRSTDLLPN